MGYLKNKEQSLHEYKSDLALVRKLQLHFKFSNVHALIWEAQNVTLCFMHIRAPLSWRTRSSAATSLCCAEPCRAELTLPMGSSIHPQLPPAASWQPALALLHQHHHSPSECKLGHGTSFPSGIRVIVSGKRLAGKHSWGLLWLVLPGSSLAFSNLQMPGRRMANTPHDSPFPHLVWMLFWLTLWQWSMNYKGWILQNLVLCIDIYVRETRVLRRYKKLPNQWGSLLYHNAEMQMICKAAGNQTSVA